MYHTHIFSRWAPRPSACPPSAFDWIREKAKRDIPVWSLCGSEAYDPRLGTAVKRTYLNQGYRVTWRESLAAVKEARVVVLHLPWRPDSMLFAELAKLQRVPYIVSSHGEFAPSIYRRLRGPISLRLALIQRMLSNAEFVHVYTEEERGWVEEIACDARVFVCPPGITLPSRSWVGGEDYLCWIGRYDIEHKGLDLLVAALQTLDPRDRPNVVLRGVESRNSRYEVIELAKRVGVSGSVDVGPPVYGSEKQELLARSRGYLHVSRWESFGKAIFEALALGVPTLVTNTCAVATELASFRSAITVGTGANELATGIVQLYEGSESSSLSDRARMLVATKHNWSKQIEGFQRRIGDAGEGSCG